MLILNKLLKTLDAQNYQNAGNAVLEYATSTRNFRQIGFELRPSWNWEKRRTNSLSAMVFHRHLKVTSGLTVVRPEPIELSAGHSRPVPKTFQNPHCTRLNPRCRNRLFQPFQKQVFVEEMEATYDDRLESQSDKEGRARGVYAAEQK